MLDYGNTVIFNNRFGLLLSHMSFYQKNEIAEKF